MDVKKAINNFDSCFSTKKINEKRQSIHQQKKNREQPIEYLFDESLDFSVQQNLYVKYVKEIVMISTNNNATIPICLM